MIATLAAGVIALTFSNVPGQLALRHAKEANAKKAVEMIARIQAERKEWALREAQERQRVEAELKEMKELLERHDAKLKEIRAQQAERATREFLHRPLHIYPTPPFWR